MEPICTKNLKFAHIVKDDKFPDFAYEAFEEVVPGKSDYFLPKKSKKIRHLKKIKPIKVFKFEYLNPFFIRKLLKYDAVFIHGLTGFACELVKRGKGKIKFVWIGMGCDYYDMIFEDSNELLKPETKAIKEKLSKRYSGFFQNIRKKLSATLFQYRNYKKTDISKKIQYFAPVLESEYIKLKTMYPDSIGKYVDWNYGAPSKLIDGGLSVSDVVGMNILIGNSAAITNNHVDVFKMLKDVPLKEKSKLIVPLSYGGRRYRKIVVEQGRFFFGERFYPVLEFLNYNDYMNLVASCSVVIMNHKRQQAGTNIAVALFMGARVFLDPDNAFYKEYLDNGVVIHSIAELTSSPHLIYSPLPSVEVARNKEILKKMWGHSKIIDKTKKLLDVIQENKKVLY